MPTGIYNRKPMSEETKRKISTNHSRYWLGKKKPLLDETKKKISKSLMGHSMSNERLEKLKECSTFKKGFTPWNKGVPCSKETRQKISNTNIEKGIEPKLKYVGRGENGANWKGGVTPENQAIRTSIEFRLWRESVYARDNWTCQCTGEKGGKIHAHHIHNFADYPELRFAIDNGITLSDKSHMKFHSMYGVKNNTEEQLKEFLDKERIWTENN